MSVAEISADWAVCAVCRGRKKVLVDGRQIRDCLNCRAKGVIPPNIDAAERELPPLVVCRLCGGTKEAGVFLFDACKYCEQTLWRNL